jgi:hypothetical protein
MLPPPTLRQNIWIQRVEMEYSSWHAPSLNGVAIGTNKMIDSALVRRRITNLSGHEEHRHVIVIYECSDF